VLLPSRPEGLGVLEQRLSHSMLQDCAASLQVREVELFLPRFTVTWGTFNMAELLGSLGMTLAFTDSADFSGINGARPPQPEALFLKAVFHKAFIEVNEEGTEAAAATAAVTELRSPQKPLPVVVFRADRPFLFAIRERRSGIVLFLGHITDPA
jgi:serpin B